MARLYPSGLNAGETSGGNAREIATLKQLAKELPNDYSIFHSVHWSSATGKDGVDHGEVDFVVVNLSGDVLVIEQKDGGLEESPEGLRKRYADGSKLIESQINRNMWSLRNKFQQRVHLDQEIAMDYLLYCPGHKVVNMSAAGVAANRIVDASAKSRLSNRIEELLGPGIDHGDNRVDIVCDYFAQRFRIAPDVGAYVASQDLEYTRLLEGLGDAIQKLEFSPFRLRVTGTAGCGKTQLTLRFAQQEIAAGRRPLLLCFNRPLADRLASLAPAEATVDTYYGFCKDTLESVTVGLRITPTQTPGFWRELQDQLVGIEIPEASKFGSLIVDEGQDFKQEWWEILQLFLTDDASVLWLEDPLQNLRDTDEVTLDGFVTYREDANFRTPLSIAPVIKDALGVEFTQRNRLPGLGVYFDCYEKPGDQLKIVDHRINELRRMGFANTEISVISCRGMSSTAFAGCDSLGGIDLRRFTGGYTSDGQQIYTEGNLIFDTLYRFKGQQAPAVILVDVDETIDVSDRARRILYCGMTRATVRLEMLVAKESPWLDVLRKATR